MANTVVGPGSRLNPQTAEEASATSDQLDKETQSVTAQTATLERKQRSLSRAITELRRAQNAYDRTERSLQEDAQKSYDKLAAEVTQLQRAGEENSARILRMLNRTAQDALVQQSSSIVSAFDKAYSPTVIQKLHDDIVKRFEERRLGIWQRGGGGFIDRALTRHENRNQYVRDMRATGQYSDQSNAALKERYDVSMKIQREIAIETKKLQSLTERVGERAASRTHLYARVADLTERLRAIDSRFVSDSEKASAMEATPEAPGPVDMNGLAPDVVARLDKARARMAKLSPEEPSIEPVQGEKPSWMGNPETAEVAGFPVLEKTLTGILAAVESIDRRLERHWRETDIKAQAGAVEAPAMGGVLGAGLKGVAGGLLGSIGNFAGGLLGRGSGLASILGRVAGIAAAGYQLYDSYKNFDKDTKDAQGNRLGFFDHKKGSSILSSRAGYYGRNALAGGELGLQVGSMFGPEGAAIGAGVGALGGLAFTFWQDYHKEIVAKLQQWKKSISAFVDSVQDSIVNVAHSVTKTLEGWKNKFESIYTSASKDVDAVATGIADRVKNLGHMLLDMITSIPKAIWNAVSSRAKAVGGWAEHAFDSLRNYVHSETHGKGPAHPPISTTTALPKELPPRVMNGANAGQKETGPTVNQTVVAPTTTNINNSRTAVVGKYATRNDDKSVNSILTSRDLAFAI